MRINPQLDDAYVNLALLLRSLNKNDALQELLRDDTGNRNDSAGTKFIHGLLALDGEDNETAERFFRSGLELDPHSVPLLSNLGVALTRQSKTSDAVEYYRRALAIDPNNAEVNLNMADSLKYEKPSESRSYVDRSLLSEPGNAKALDLLGFTWMLSENLPNAIAAFDSALEADPSFSRAAYHKAGALFLTDDLGSAWQIYGLTV